jgi:hypothetical protein
MVLMGTSLPLMDSTFRGKDSKYCCLILFLRQPGLRIQTDKSFIRRLKEESGKREILHSVQINIYNRHTESTTTCAEIWQQRQNTLVLPMTLAFPNLKGQVVS